MKTDFTADQLQTSEIKTADAILRSCVHCGMCTATCPTYLTLGDELDSPRGRIYLIKDMLEDETRPVGPAAQHLDRCLSCLACMTTCPSGVDYMHLIDMARDHVETHYRRPLFERLYRRFLGLVLPQPWLFRLTMRMAALARPFKGLFPARLKPALDLVPPRLAAPSPTDRPHVFPAEGERRKRVALLSGCAQPVIEPSINAAAIRLLTRLGCEVVVAKGAGCCGALNHHLGQAAQFRHAAKRNIAAWLGAREAGGLDAILITTSGCGTVIKDYGYLFREDPEWADKAKAVSEMTQDISTFLAGFDLAPVRRTGQPIAYHAACSLQHGQRVLGAPKALLTAAGFAVRDIPEGHLCCGSAGTYNLMQPEIAGALRTRKLANIALTSAKAVVAGNVGCITQMRAGGGLPVLHLVELIDWATGGPLPPVLEENPDF